MFNKLSQCADDIDRVSLDLELELARICSVKRIHLMSVAQHAWHDSCHRGCSSHPVVDLGARLCAHVNALILEGEATQVCGDIVACTRMVSSARGQVVAAMAAVVKYDIDDSDSTEC